MQLLGVHVPGVTTPGVTVPGLTVPAAVAAATLPAPGAGPITTPGVTIPGVVPGVHAAAALGITAPFVAAAPAPATHMITAGVVTTTAPRYDWPIAPGIGSAPLVTTPIFSPPALISIVRGNIAAVIPASFGGSISAAIVPRTVFASPQPVPSAQAAASINALGPRTILDTVVISTGLPFHASTTVVYGLQR